MFIFTTKFNKKKAIAAVMILAAILVAVILIAGSAGKADNTGKDSAKETAALSAIVKNNEQRVNYLKALGWEVEQNVLEQQKVVIPRTFTDVYKQYNDIQLAQGFDLTKYGGVEVTRYTYRVLNFPESTGTVVADIIIYKNEVIAGDVQSNALDGFMVGLEYPAPAEPDASADTNATASEQMDSAELTAEDVLASADTADGAQSSLSDTPAEAGALPVESPAAP